MPPLLEIAERALGMLDADGLVSLSGKSVVVVAVREGRAGRAEGPGTEEADLRRLCKAAWVRAGQARAWPVRGLPPATVGEVERGGPIREAIATTWGTRTYETREPAGSRDMPDFRRVRLEDGRILGPEAVSQLLRALGPVFGVELGLGADPPAASEAVTLTDDGGDIHSFDAEGTRRQRTLVVHRGRFVQPVRDSATGPTSGHATRPLTASASADHLRLEPTVDDVGAPTVPSLPALRAAEARALLGQIVAVG